MEQRIRDLKAEANRYFEEIGVRPTSEDILYYVLDALQQEGEDVDDILFNLIKEVV